MNTAYISKNLSRIYSVQIGNRTISLANRTLTIEGGDLLLVATHPEGDVKVIPMSKIDEFNFNPADEEMTKDRNYFDDEEWPLPLGHATGLLTAGGDVYSPDAGLSFNDLDSHVDLVGKSGRGESNYPLKRVLHRKP